jgi:hypothetical protein
MKSRTWLLTGVSTLMLLLSLTLSGRTALGQLGCIDDCLEGLADCTNRTGGSQECEDNYDACVEDCLLTT